MHKSKESNITDLSFHPANYYSKELYEHKTASETRLTSAVNPR